MAQDTIDVVLQQATMVAFCIPEVGPILAAITSAAEALHDAFGKHEQPARYSMPQAIADLGVKIEKMLEGVEHDALLNTVRGWEHQLVSLNNETKNWVDDESGDVRAVVTSRVADFEENLDFDTAIGFFGASSNTSKSEERVKSLGSYFRMRGAYQSLLQAKLMWIARAFDQGPDKWCHISGDLVLKIRNDFIRSFSDAQKYAEETVKMVEDAYTELDNYTEDNLKGVTSALKRNQMLTKKLRALNNSAHLNSISRDQVKRYRELLKTYDASHAGMLKLSTSSHWDQPKSKSNPAGGNQKPTKKKTLLGKRPQNSLRVVFETAADDKWVGVLENSPLEKSTTLAKVQGPIVSQDAGSSDSAIYYQIGGGGLNGAFDAALLSTGQRTNVNQALKSAYNKRYNNEWKKDAAAASQKRLTSFFVPLDPTAQKSGDNVYAMVYSVGPKLTNGITDETAYQKIYTDALDLIANHNAKFTPITNFRVALISTELYGGNSDPAALRSKAAELVLKAATQALTNKKALANLTLIVNSNEKTGGDARIAFASAGKTLNCTVTDEGFYVSYVPSSSQT